MKGNITLKIKNLILLLILVSFAPIANAQLQTGDIAFVGINSDTNPNEIAILTLSSIASGQTILLTDYAWNGSSLETGNSSAEGFITWTTNTIVPAGTLIKITIGSGAVIGGGLSDFGSVSATGWSADAIASGGDNWFVLQGSIAAPTFIYAYANWSTSAYGTKTWPSTGVTFPNATISYLPSSLSNGTTANIQSGSPLYHFDNNVYTGIKSGTKAAILLAIADSANWSGSEVDTETKDLTPGGTNFPGVNPIFTIGSPVSISGQPSNISTCTNTNASFSIVASNATGYQWQVNEGSGFTNIANGAPYSGATTTTLTITAVTAGMSGYSYRCVVSGADSATSNSGTLTVSNTIVTTTSQTNVSCKGGSNGSAILSASGGIAPYTYSWSPSGGTAATASGLSAQTYTVTVTDNIGCVKTHTVIITEPAATLVATAAAQTNVSCFGGSNGSATVALTGGTPSYTYSWSPSGGTGATASGLTTGTYTCTVTDANGCTATQSFTITQSTALVVTPASQTNVSCFGGSNGSAAINTPTGGAGGYTYDWTPGTPTGDGTTSVTGLTAGTWTCTVTDANGCTETQSFTLTQPTAITVTPASQTNIACNGGSTGAAAINTPTGGAGGYTYDWTPGTPTGDGTTSVTGLNAGTYTIKVTDANGCTATQSFTVTQPSALAVTPASQTNVSCFGGSNGTATVSVSGGTSAYTYAWSPSGGTAATATGLSAGTYTVTVTDANACIATQSFTITQPPVLAVTPASQTNVSCFGGSNGSATVSVSGGTSAYTYAWSPSGGTTATASGLSAGTYTVTVTDANACIATQSFTITQPAVLAVTPASQTNVSCFGGSNGSATVSVSGGTSAYTYAWSPSGGTAAIATGLAAGTYTVIVTDANGCTATQNFTITQPTALVATAATQTNVTCNGGADGSATVSVSGGTSGYTYAWAPTGGTAATATGLSAGTYTVTVTDANGCVTTQGFTITQPTAIGFTTTVLSGYDYNTGYSQTIVASGGTGAKTYAVTTGSLPSGFNLLPNGEITGTSTQIAASNFTVTATDENNCITTHDFILKLNQIPITVTATASQTKIYGAADPILIYLVSPNLENGDTFSGALLRASGEDIGDYAINVGTLSAGSKYLMTFVGSNFAITAKPITVTADVAQTKVYGTADPVFTYSVAPSLVSGDSFTGNLTRVAGQNIGNYAIEKGSLSAGNNYDITYVSKDFAITAKPITITADASQTKVYGTADPVFTYSVVPSLVSGDSFTGNLTRVAGQNIGNYAIEKGSLSVGSNYDITYISNDFAITAKPITVIADTAQTKVYGAANPIYTYTVSPSLVGSDAFTGALTRAVGENIGTYAITQGSLSAGSNYSINYVSEDFAITAKPITVTANPSQTKVYGTADPVFAYSVSPSLVGSDAFTGSLTRAAGENVGTYAIGQGNLSAGSNYTIDYVGTTFSITKADQLISWNQVLSLGCDGETTVLLTASSSSGLAVSYASSDSNIATISNGLLVTNNYGSAIITSSQAGNANYNAAAVVELAVVNSQPNLIRKQFENIIFFDNSSNSFKSYSWYKNGVLVPGQTAQYFKESGALNGIYHAVATKLDGTLITSCPLILSPTVEEEYIKIVPNPVKPDATYELVTNVSSSRLQNARIEVYGIGGLLIENKTTSQNTVSLKAPTVEGIYIVKMTLANGKYFTKNLLVKN
ncbi:MBG domain-containing protein [Flavobacterium acetivorans]|uniref:MBG domain-containing protein n=1 Tax=Flavobacterium acetivorans TaxID=2893883 RepID=UPI001E3E3821|nr:MBG domain-containing protein [Flavobacterium sp. F-29]UFH34398.1 putative Ig domain-containing protein [Flavobacterium sp. F-29]